LYDLIAAGLPSGGPGSMALFTTPQVTAPASTTTVRAGATMMNAYSTSGAQSFFVDAFDLTSVAPPGSPVITTSRFRRPLPLAETRVSPSASPTQPEPTINGNFTTPTFQHRPLVRHHHPDPDGDRRFRQ